MEKKLTVFTPTYNREELLKRAYSSLKNQTNSNFIWLIVDDGSTDNTRELVAEWIRKHEESCEFEIRYKYCENGGKMRAHNIGASLCDTKWFVCLDSDDMLTIDAVETIYDCLEEIDNDANIAGIVAHKGKSKTELLSNVEFPKGISVSTLFGLYLKGFKGETTLVLRTDVLKEFPFPEIEGEKYVPEDYIYDKIDMKYVFKVLPKILTVCEIVSEGYTKSVLSLKENNKEAWYLYYEQRARITPMSVLKLKYLGFYRLYAKKTGHKLSESAGISKCYKLLGIPGELMLSITGKQ